LNKEKIANFCVSYIRLFRSVDYWSREFSFKSRPRIYRARITYEGEFRGEYCDYINQAKVDRCNKRTQKIVKRLREGTQFQRWLAEKPAFKELIDSYRKKIWKAQWNDEFNSHFAISTEEFFYWKFLYILACSILVYTDPLRFKSSLVRLGEIERVTPSKKAQKLATNLYSEILSLGLVVPPLMERYLIKIADGEPPTVQRPIYTEPRLSANKRRRLMIREIACVSRDFLLLAKSTNHRFPPELVALMLAIVGNKTDLRTIQFIQKPYDGKAYDELPIEEKIRLEPMTSGKVKFKKDVASPPTISSLTS